jgi:hypothetical protein
MTIFEDLPVHLPSTTPLRGSRSVNPCRGSLEWKPQACYGKRYKNGNLSEARTMAACG